MKHCVTILSVLFFAACGTGESSKVASVTASAKTDTVKVLATTISAPLNDSLPGDDQMATYFVVIADTGQDYPALRQEMTDLNRQFMIPIDTMGRSYNAVKNLIALPEDDEDEIYAGDYFPRRFPSENLSLEYLSVYKDGAGEKTIALVTGIYKTSKNADSARSVLQKNIPGAFVIKADLYIGCMH
ncbi:MAG: hypothetical protein ABW019_09185 [Chitinophagaceae bacterium]